VSSWRAAVRPRTHHLLPNGDLTAAVDRLARRVTGRSIGIVLSGGGARGLAHIGALRGLRSAGLGADRLGGTSMGALVAALAATGRVPDEIEALLRRELVTGRPFNDYTVPRRSVIRGAKALAMLDRLFGDAELELLGTALFVISADLRSGERVVHRQGRLRDAVAASMAIPGFAPPVMQGGRLLVDGGVLDNLPVEVMIGDGEGPVVAVDVMRRADRSAPRRRARPVRIRPQRPPIVETMVRATLLGSWERATRSRDRADVVITPAVDDIGLLEFDCLDQAVAAGEAAVAAALRSGGLAALHPVDGG
jgi:NTE family protein